MFLSPHCICEINKKYRSLMKNNLEGYLIMDCNSTDLLGEFCKIKTIETTP